MHNKLFKLFEKMFNMSFIVFDTYYVIFNISVKCFKIYHWTFCPSVDIVVFWIFMFYMVVWWHNRCDAYATMKQISYRVHWWKNCENCLIFSKSMDKVQ